MPRPRLSATGLTIVAGALLTLASCETAPPSEHRAQTQPQPASPTTSAAEPAKPISPAEPAAPTPPRPPWAGRTEPPPPTPPETPEPPKTPDYVTVLERFDERAPVQVQVQPARGNRLAIDTQNVKRMRLARERLPIDGRRTVALQLDTQGIEWLANSPVVEFERSTNGAWTPVRPLTAPRKTP
jgi:hypothetical protein